MDCTQIDRYLDQMMDGELEANALRELEAHCDGCAECAEKLRANRQMMLLFAQTAPEMDVPLSAQAAWRGAVKQAAGRSKRRRLSRVVGAVAAVLVVAVIATFALRPSAKDAASSNDADMGEVYMDAEEALIETDGAAGQAEAFSEAADLAAPMNAMLKAAGAPMQEIDLVVDDVDRVCDYARDLVEEYEGTVDIQRYDEDGIACANLYIELPGASSKEFLQAIKPFDLSGGIPEPIDVEGRTALMLVLKSE